MIKNQVREAIERPLYPRRTDRRPPKSPKTLRLNAVVALAVIAALVPVMLLSIYQSITAREAMNRMIGERLVASATITALEQRDPLLMARGLLESIADDAQLTGTSRDCGAKLYQRLESRTPLVNLARWDNQGRLVCSAVAAGRTNITAEKIWWDQLQENKSFLISGPLQGQIVRRSLLLAIRPLGERGALSGALTAAIDMSWIERSLAERRLSPRAIVGIADAKGRLLASSGAADRLPLDIKASDRRLASAEGALGMRWLYASAPLYEQQLYVFYAEPENMAFSLSREQFRAGMIVPIFAILLSCFAVWLALDRFVLRWLRLAGSRTRMLADGDYRLHPGDFRSAPVELRQLGDAIQDMAAAIAERDLALRRALVDKDAMAREVNHRVKNNLQMISSLVSLQAARLADPNARRLMTQTRLRVSALALVHRLIYELDDSERGLVDTAQLFRELRVQIEPSVKAGSVVLTCQSRAGSISGDQAVAASLIVVEAVTNAFRHGFPDARSGRIDVLMRAEGKEAILSITDDGVGDDSPAINTGMGHDLMRALADQLNGLLVISPTEGGGRTVTVRFSVSRNMLI